MTFTYHKRDTGTDTIKRGASPAMSITSTSTARFKESNSSYSIKQQENQSKDGKETSTIDRQKSSNSTYGPISSTILPARSVLFSTDLVSSSSAYSIKDQTTKPNPPNSTSNMPTSAAIKQTLSPLSQHRNNTSSAMHATSASAEPNYSLKNQITSSPSLGTYQFPSSSINLKNNATSSLTEHNTSMSPSSVRKTSSSPSRTLSNNNTLPSSVVRNYQSDSSYNLKNHQQQQQPMNFTSPGNNTNSSSALHHYQSNNTNIYGTLPKTQFGGGGGSSNHHSTHNNSLLGSTTGNNEIELINRHSSGSTVTTSNGGYNTLGSYKVQYSSTNPFLQGFNPQYTDSTSSGDKVNEE